MELLGLSIDIVVFLLIGSCIAGFIDAICGGGGLISIPVLLTAGFSPAQAIAANKLQGTVGAIASTQYYLNKGVLDKKLLIALLPPAIIGGAIGTATLSLLPSTLLEKILPFLLIAMALYFYFSKNLSDTTKKAKMGIFLFSWTIIPVIAFYDGFFGAGAGTFYLLAVTSLLGFAATKAMAYSRVLNLASNLISLLVFIYLGKMAWMAGILMAIGETIGVYLGSHLVVKNGAKLMRPLVVIACVLMAIKLLWSSS